MVKLYQSRASSPASVQGLLRLLLSRPQATAARAPLADLFEPPALRADDEPGLFEATAAALVELGLIEREGEGDESRVRLARDWPAEQRDPARVHTILPGLLARHALQPEIDGEPNRLAWACAWLLAWPVGGIPSGPAAILEAISDLSDGSSADLDFEEEHVIHVVTWAKYLGLIRQIRDKPCEGLVADPTVYLGRILSEVLPGTEAVPVQQFRADLGRVSPILDGGSVRERILTAYGFEAPPSRFSPAVAFALRRLARDGRIELRYFNDAHPETFLLLGADERVTSVRRLTKEERT